MKKLVMIGLIVALFVACSKQTETKTIKGGDEKEYVVNETEQIKNFGNNIYYFPYTNDQFAVSLSEFLSSHEGLEVSSNAPRFRDGGINSGLIIGYFVTFRSKP